MPHLRRQKCLLLVIIILSCSLFIYIFQEENQCIDTESNSSNSIELFTFASQLERVRFILNKYKLNESDTDIQRWLSDNKDIQQWLFNAAIPLPILTLFTTWKNREEKRIVVKNTIHNWSSLFPFVKIIVFVDSQDEINVDVRSKHIKIMPVPSKTTDRLPLFKEMFRKAMEQEDSLFYSYCNSDILFTPAIIDTLLMMKHLVTNRHRSFLIVGRRTEVLHVTEEEATTFDRIERVASTRGKLRSSDAVDYFITLKHFPFGDFPDLVIGRPGYDNYVIMHARKHKVAVIDGSSAILAVHQTTQAGNMESHNSTNVNYNIDLLKKNYGINIPDYQAGFISCSAFKLEVDTSRRVTLYRKRHRIKDNKHN